MLTFDLRLIIYDLVLADARSVTHSVQPHNAHLRLLHVCRQVYYEAHPSFSRYVSLRNEFQIDRFLKFISSSPESALSVRWADVANDGRIVETGRATPVSQLHRVLARLTRLETLRVFDVRRYHPVNSPQLRYRLDFEGAMYPPTVHEDGGSLPHLSSYELYLDPSTRVSLFDRLPSDGIHTLRLSADCRLTAQVSFPALRHLTMRSVTSNAFDRVDFRTLFATSPLVSFTHAQGDRLGFEMRNAHLESIVDGPGRALRKLVLLGCTRLSSSVIATCLRNLPTLEYFALSFVTVNELRENFIVALGPSLRTLKLQVTHAWYSVPLFDEERIICDSLEERILSPTSPLDTIYVSFHGRLLVEDGREERWKRIALARHVMLKIGPWEDIEET